MLGAQSIQGEGGGFLKDHSGNGGMRGRLCPGCRPGEGGKTNFSGGKEGREGKNDVELKGWETKRVRPTLIQSVDRKGQKGMDR